MHKQFRHLTVHIQSFMCTSSLEQTTVHTQSGYTIMADKSVYTYSVMCTIGLNSHCIYNMCSKHIFDRFYFELYFMYYTNKALLCFQLTGLTYIHDWSAHWFCSEQTWSLIGWRLQRQASSLAAGSNSYWSELCASTSLISYGDARQTFGRKVDQKNYHTYAPI